MNCIKYQETAAVSQCSECGAGMCSECIDASEYRTNNKPMCQNCNLSYVNYPAGANLQSVPTVSLLARACSRDVARYVSTKYTIKYRHGLQVLQVRASGIFSGMYGYEENIAGKKIVPCYKLFLNKFGHYSA
jgi:hypothetical protein